MLLALQSLDEIPLLRGLPISFSLKFSDKSVMMLGEQGRKKWTGCIWFGIGTEVMNLRVMAAKLTRLAHKIAIQLHLVA
jgi:hypothetical protein